MTIVYAVLGAMTGLALVYFGIGVHIGQTNLGGLPAYALSAIAGAAVLLVIRVAIHKTLGSIIP